MKFYAVRVGRQPGVYSNWQDCQQQVHGYSRAEYRSFSSEEAAQEWLGHAVRQPQPATHIAAPPRQTIVVPTLFVAPPRRSSSSASSSSRSFSSESSSANSSSAPVEPPLIPLQPRCARPTDESLIFSLFCDGASRSNPGPAGCGGVLWSHDKRLITEYKHYLGSTVTNNIAEYQGLILGLQHAIRLGINALIINSDSMLVMQQTGNKWRVRADGLEVYHARAQALLDQLDWWELRAVPRAENSDADRLANEAIDQRANNVFFDVRTNTTRQQEDTQDDEDEDQIILPIRVPYLQPINGKRKVRGDEDKEQDEDEEENGNERPFQSSGFSRSSGPLSGRQQRYRGSRLSWRNV